MISTAPSLAASLAVAEQAQPLFERWQAAPVGKGDRDMSSAEEDLKSGRAATAFGMRARTYALGWAAALTFALAMPPACAEEAKPLAAEPTPYQKPLNWGGLPAPTALVHVNTSVGAFTLPMGYLSDWFALRDQWASTASDGLRQFSSELVYEFEYPGGWMNANTPFVRAVRDAAGRVVAGRTVVYIEEIRPSDRDGDDLAAATLGRYPSGTLAREPASSWGGQETLHGTAAGSGPGHRIGVDLSCGIDCLFRFYLEHEHLVLRGVLDGRFRHDGLAIAEQAQALFERWKTALSKGE